MKKNISYTKPLIWTSQNFENLYSPYIGNDTQLYCIKFNWNNKKIFLQFWLL